ncbi:MAG: DnaA ATPase domain-containing protein, partial [Gemmatimonadales bacterium]
ARPVMGVVNQRFTFDRYLPADGNRIARQCCLDVLGGSFSVTPVVLYGRPGLGKTHLLHALASRAASAGWSVACLSAEEFTSRFTGAIRERAVHDFHESVRTVRLLLIDDLQDLAGKKATQEEFVHTIDAVSNGGGYVVAASEQHPLELNLPERLSSRLTAGVAAQIEPFIADERRRYIELLAEESGVAMPEWAVDRMAGIEAPSVRVLQGAINAGLALARDGSLDLGRLDAALIQVAVLEASTGVLAERELLERVARHFELCFDDLLGASRKAQVAAARAVVAAVLQERGKSLSQIGGMLSRHRSTINELAVRGRRLLEADAALRARVG